MIIHNVKQGEPSWLALRAEHDTSSEASAMMGASKNVKRNELLHQKATNTPQQFSEWVQRNLLDRGHNIEAKARPIIEQEYGIKLFPVVGSSEKYPRLLASFDGITAFEDTIWECKSWNADKASHILAYAEIPPEDLPQVVQQLVVSGAKRCIYTVSDGTPIKTISVEFSLDEAGEYESKLIRSWNQFNFDRENYVQQDPSVDVIAAPVAGLPTINYQLNGLSLTSNLSVFRAAAEKAVIEAKKELNSDQDFADREALNKAFEAAEKKITLVREQVIGEIKDVDKFTRELAEIGELIRQARLAGEKQVTKRKDILKQQIVDKVTADLANFCNSLESHLIPVRMPRVAADFVGKMKGKKKLDSLQDAADTELARVKIEQVEISEKIAANLTILREKTKEEQRFLFRDVQDLALKDSETLLLIIDQRITEHTKAEEKRLEDEREKIRTEELAKIAQETLDREAQEEADRIANEPKIVESAAEEPTTASNQNIVIDPKPINTSSPAIISTIKLVNGLELIRAVADLKVSPAFIDVNIGLALKHYQETGEILPGMAVE